MQSTHGSVCAVKIMQSIHSKCKQKKSFYSCANITTNLQQTLVFCRAAGGFQELDSYTGSELVDVIDYLVNNPSALFTLGDHFNSLNIHFANRDFG